MPITLEKSIVVSFGGIRLLTGWAEKGCSRH